MGDGQRKQSKFRLFIENFLIYGVGGVISKLIPLIMLPIITRLISDTTYFGISDLSNTVVQFGGALAVIGMYDAMYRMFFERNGIQFKKQVCSTTVVFTVGMSIVVTVLMVLCKDLIAQHFFGSIKYSYLVYITAVTTLVSATNQIVSAPTRMQNKRKVFLITNAVGPLISYSIAITLIVKGYYVAALPLAALISGITMESAFWILNRKWFSIKLFDKALLKQLLILGIPMFPNFLIYWIFNSSDKLMIANLINVGASGVYSVGSKLGHASQLIYTAFAGGWQYFAFSTMKEDGQVHSNTKVFECLGAVSYCATAFVCVISYPLFIILFSSDYLEGYIIAPYLFLAPLLQMLYQVSSNQFLIIKKTWPALFLLGSGAIANVFLNLLLIPMIGIEGASIATLSGYIISLVITVMILQKINLMELNKRFLLASILMAVYFLIWRIFISKNFVLSFVLFAVFVFILGHLYKNEVDYISEKIKAKIRKR